MRGLKTYALVAACAALALAGLATPALATDLSVTAASVIAGSNAVVEHGTAGATITAGQVLYTSTTNGKYLKADSNDASVTVRTPRCIALNGASDGQPMACQRSGDITIGATMTAGVAYYLSDTPGGICPVADVGSGEYVVLMGLAKSTTVLSVAINYTGVAN